MPLVEVVRAERTDDASYAAAYELIVACGKQAVRCNDTPGFVVNRLLIPLINDAVRALDEIGIEPAEIDLAMTNGAGWPMGPFRLIDLIGVDVHVHAAEALYAAVRRAAHGASASPPPHARGRPAGAQDGPRLLRLPCGRVSPEQAKDPELTESLPPQHRVMTAPRDNRVMRLPSHQRPRVSRALLLRGVLDRAACDPRAGARCAVPRARRSRRRSSPRASGGRSSPAAAVSRTARSSPAARSSSWTIRRRTTSRSTRRWWRPRMPTARARSRPPEEPRAWPSASPARSTA